MLGDNLKCLKLIQMIKLPTFLKII